jgi:squalene cyclase
MVPMPVEPVQHTNELERAISGAIDYLLCNRLLSGMWYDFPASAIDDPWFFYFAASDEWVSAYVAAAIASFERDDARRAAQWVWRVLCRRRRAGEGWGFGVVTPADADSTVWGLHVAHAIGASGSPHAIAAYVFLRQHQHSHGGIATYLPEDSIRLFATSGVNPWCEAHACVTAAAANLPDPQPEWLRYLRSAQQSDGRWDGFWWMDSEYATGLATAALARTNDPQDRGRIETAVRWTIGRIAASGGVFSAAANAESPFATAWSLRTLLSVPNHSEARALAMRQIEWLLREQRPDGSWHPSAWLRTPPIDVNDPNGFANRILALDRNANFTTASVLAALGSARGIWKSY